jgi:diadenosine tetraphosphatase ApaH/serine/threonine PP2A family protein phosphatase
VVELGGEERALLNVGSVGQPRDGDWRASYALWDPIVRRMVARRVEYDLETAARKIRAAGLPEVLAKRLAVGQ